MMRLMKVPCWRRFGITKGKLHCKVLDPKLYLIEPLSPNSFLRRRFDPPPLSSSSSDDQGSDTVSIGGSIAESVSSDGLEAMWEIES
jgi:hypothetical protein